MNNPHKIDLRLPNGVAFSEEGSPELMRELFTQLMEAVKVAPPPAITPPNAAIIQPLAGNGQGGGGDVGAGTRSSIVRHLTDCSDSTPKMSL